MSALTQIRFTGNCASRWSDCVNRWPWRLRGSVAPCTGSTGTPAASSAADHLASGLAHAQLRAEVADDVDAPQLRAAIGVAAAATACSAVSVNGEASPGAGTSARPPFCDHAQQPAQIGAVEIGERLAQVHTLAIEMSEQPVHARRRTGRRTAQPLEQRLSAGRRRTAYPTAPREPRPRCTSLRTTGSSGRAIGESIVCIGPLLCLRVALPLSGIGVLAEDPAQHRIASRSIRFWWRLRTPRIVGVEAAEVKERERPTVNRCSALHRGPARGCGGSSRRCCTAGRARSRSR